MARMRHQPQAEAAAGGLEENVVRVYRCAKVVKGGRRFSFAALLVAGDRCGRVGMGYAKAKEVPAAVEKARKRAMRDLATVTLQGVTLPHAVTGRFGASRVRLIPASEGTGIIAGQSVRAVLELVGIQDCLTKVYGSTSPKNVVKAVMDGLHQLRNREQVEALRGVSLAN